MPPREQTRHKQPTGGELDKFNKLLISGIFNEGDYKIRTLQVCIAWLKARQTEVSMWTPYFRKNRSKLLETLLKMQTDLTALYTLMDRLSGDHPSFFADSPFAIPNRIFALHSEYLAVNDSAGDLLEAYLNYANSYKTYYDRGEILDTSKLSVTPEELRDQFLEKFGLIHLVLGKMAVSVAALVKRRAGLADPGDGQAAAES